MRELLDEFLPYLMGAWVYRWWASAVAIAVCIAGFLYVFAIPNVYEANARIYIDANSRLRDVVRQLGMEPDVTSRVFLVRQALAGRPQLERVARETDLDLNVTSDLEREQMLKNLSEKVSISSGRGVQGQNLFLISYTHSDRVVAYSVVKEMLDVFVEDVLEEKNTDTRRTRDFLDTQLQHYRGLLSETEQKLQSFKREHPFFVIGNSGDYFQRLRTAEANLEDVNARKKVLVSRQNELRKQLGNIAPYAATGEESLSMAVVSGSAVSQRLNQMRQTLRDLLLRFTERHPEVIATREQIKLLEEQWQEEIRKAAEAAADEGVSAATNPIYIEIQNLLRENNLNLAELAEQEDQIQGRLQKLQKEIDTGPILESQFVELTRDYDYYEKLYNEVLHQSERERIGRVGAEADVISFNIIDPPRAGLEPVAPNRSVLLLVVLAGSLAIGFVFTLALAQLNPRVFSPNQLQGHCGDFQFLGAISHARQNESPYSARAVLMFGVFLVVLITGAGGVVMIEEDASRIVREGLARLDLSI